MQECEYVHYGFHSISTAFEERCCCRRERPMPSIEPEQPTRMRWEERSQSLARSESIGILACEAVRCKSLRTLTQNQFTTIMQRFDSWRCWCALAYLNMTRRHAALHQILLVIFLGLPEGGRRLYDRHDRFRETSLHF